MAFTLLALSLSSCALLADFLQAAFQQPRLSFKRADLSDLSLTQLTLNTTWLLENPNAVGLSLARADYRLLVEDKPLVSGSPPLGLTIPAQGQSDLQFPTRIELASLFPVAEVLARQDFARYRVEGTVGIQTPLGVLDFPLSYQGQFEVPKLPKVELQPPKVTSYSLSGATVELPIAVTNKNSFALPLQGVTGQVRIAGQSVGSISTGDLGSLEGKGTKVVKVPLTVNLLQAAGALRTALSGGTADVQLQAELQSGQTKVPLDVQQVLQFLR